MVPENNKSFINPNSANQMLYANGFAAGTGSFDMYIIGMLNGEPNFTLNMSFTTAKALQKLMNDAISEFESKAGITIPTNEEIAKKLEQSNSKGAIYEQTTGNF